MSPILALIAIGIALAIAYYFLFHGHSIEVTLTSDGVKHCRGISSAAEKRFQQLGPELLPTGAQIKFHGIKSKGERIRWVVKDDPDVPVQQLRNVLANERVFS